MLQPDLYQQWGSRINICRCLLLQRGQVKTTILYSLWSMRQGRQQQRHQHSLPHFRCNRDVPVMPDPTEAPGPDNTTPCPGWLFFAFPKFVNPDDKCIIFQSVWNATVVVIWRMGILKLVPWVEMCPSVTVGFMMPKTDKFNSWKNFKRKLKILQKTKKLHITF